MFLPVEMGPALLDHCDREEPTFEYVFEWCSKAEVGWPHRDGGLRSGEFIHRLTCENETAVTVHPNALPYYGGNVRLYSALGSVTGGAFCPFLCVLCTLRDHYKEQLTYLTFERVLNVTGDHHTEERIPSVLWQ